MISPVLKISKSLVICATIFIKLKCLTTSTFLDEKRFQTREIKRSNSFVKYLTNITENWTRVRMEMVGRFINWWNSKNNSTKLTLSSSLHLTKLNRWSWNKDRNFEPERSGKNFIVTKIFCFGKNMQDKNTKMFLVNLFTAR